MQRDSDAIEQQVRAFVAGLRELWKQDALELLRETTAARAKAAVDDSCPDGTGADRINKQQAQVIAGGRSEKWVDNLADQGHIQKFGGPHERPWFSRRQLEAHLAKVKSGAGRERKQKRDEHSERVAAALRKAEH